MNITRRNFLTTAAAGALAHLGGAPFAMAAAVPPELDAGYPGGNVRIVSREGDTFTLAPDLRDTKGWWFYFNFRLRGPADQPVTIRFADADPIGVRGPAMSSDGGRTWQWLDRKAVLQSGKKGSSFSAVVPAGAQEARYAFAPTYLESHLREWLAAHRANPALQVSELCRSRKGRGVELLRAGSRDPAKARGVVLLTARHHACESMASYALEGFLTAVLTDDEPGRRWRERWQVIALPFADKDGVEQGDQGKNRAPHDHCRDYNAAPLYPEVAAWMKLGDSLKQRVVFSLDMHCPYLRGDWHDRVHFVGSPAVAAAEKEKAFAQMLERVRRGPLPFRAADGILPHGVAWNTPESFRAGRSNFCWAGDTFSEARFTGAIEIPYADARGVEVNADAARALGRDLACAVLEHLEP
ncbi:MAG: M14 family zinc carboxypeptidase [Kiritimatiellaeota bacterium]|nr:M14 family zinc carboxypeptidase [Kiritimatiellota bacterium]